jgi:hypothetical protein
MLQATRFAQNFIHYTDLADIVHGCSQFNVKLRINSPYKLE